MEVIKATPLRRWGGLGKSPKRCFVDSFSAHQRSFSQDRFGDVVRGFLGGPRQVGAGYCLTD